MDMKKYRFYKLKFVFDQNAKAYDVYVFGVGVTCADTKDGARVMAKELVFDQAAVDYSEHKLFAGAQNVEDFDEILDIGPDAALKLMLRNLLVKNAVSQNELGRRLGLTKTEIGSAINLRKRTRLATLDRCFTQLGAPLQINCDFKKQFS